MKIGNAMPDSVPTSSNNRRIDLRARCGRGLKFLVREARVLTLILRHRETPWRAKLIAACTLGYLLSPVQLIPSFIPIIGQIDDVAVLFLGMKLITVVTPEGILRECRSRVTHPLVGGHARSLKTARSVARNLPEANLPKAICYAENIVASPLRDTPSYAQSRGPFCQRSYLRRRRKSDVNGTVKLLLCIPDSARNCMVAGRRNCPKRFFFHQVPAHSAHYVFKSVRLQLFRHRKRAEQRRHAHV